MTLCSLQAWTLRQFTSEKVYLFIPIWENWYKEQPPSPSREPGGFNDFFFPESRMGEKFKFKFSVHDFFFPILFGLVLKLKWEGHLKRFWIFLSLKSDWK